MKNKIARSVGLLILLPLLLAGCSYAPGFQWAGGVRLDPCTAKGSEFEKADIMKWPETYHKKVSGVIEAHLDRLSNVSGAEIDCSAGDYPSMMRANGSLSALAATLGPWKGKKYVSELEMGPVLLEYLRVYECSLQERRYFQALSPIGLTEDPQASSKAPSPTLGEYNKQVSEERDLINRELASARLILERTLSVVGGLDRLSPLAMDIECIKRTSLDLRNILGLTAEAASCMPRIWDTRGSLRDLPQSSSAPAKP